MLLKPQQDVDYILESYFELGRLYPIQDESKKLLRDILTILSIRKGSILFQPNKGTRLYDIEFASLTESTLNELKLDITSALSQEGIYAEVTVHKIGDKSVKLIIEVSLSKNEILVLDINTTKDYMSLNEIKKIFKSVVVS